MKEGGAPQSTCDTPNIASLSDGRTQCASEMNMNLRTRTVRPAIWPDFWKAKQPGSPPCTLYPLRLRRKYKPGASGLA